MADQVQSTDAKMSENPSTFFEDREYKSTTTEKCRSHQTLSFKRNLLDLEFNAAQGDSGTKKGTEDLIDLFERKSNAPNALQVANDAADSPRKNYIVVPDQNEAITEKKSMLAITLAETEEDSSPSVESGAEDLNKADEYSFDYESTEDTLERVESSLEVEDKLSENDFIQSEFVDFAKRESISDNIDVSQALLTDMISTESEVISQQGLQDLQAVETVTNDEDTNNFMNRIKNLKQSMDEINSMIAIEKDFLMQEKLELENSLTMVPFENGTNMGAQDPRKVLEEMRQKERRLKMSFQMKQLEEAQRRCDKELQLMGNTANKVDQLNQDMAVFSLDDISYMTVKDNNYSLSQRSVRTPNLSPNNSPRLSIGPETNRRGSILSSHASDALSTPFDGSLVSAIEFTMGDTRLQMQAADHFKMRITQLEAQLSSETFQPSPKMFSARRSGGVSPLSNLNAGPMKALI